MTTVAAVKRALEETIKQAPLSMGMDVSRALAEVAASPTALTLIANRLSDQGDAGNKARDRNLERLNSIHKSFVDIVGPNGEDAQAIEWAIDLLTPPEPASSGSRPLTQDEENQVWGNGNGR